MLLGALPPAPPRVRGLCLGPTGKLTAPSRPPSVFGNDLVALRFENSLNEFTSPIGKSCIRH